MLLLADDGFSLFVKYMPSMCQGMFDNSWLHLGVAIWVSGSGSGQIFG